MLLLYYSNTSPYSRKVRMLAMEKGMGATVKEILCNPFEDVPGLCEANPLGRVPTLVTDDGLALYDSPVICEFLDAQSPENRMIPEAGVARWKVRRWEALSDGILDAAYNIVMERKRPPEQQSAKWLDHWKGEILRSLAQAEQDLGELSPEVDLSHLALAAALGYLDFRLPELAWREEWPNLDSWYSDIAARASVRDTQPE